MNIDMSTGEFTRFDHYIERSSQLFRLLSVPHRLSVFAILTYGEFPVTQIFKCLTLPQNLVSHHLKVLRENGLVKSKRRGREVYYSLNERTLRVFNDAVAKVTRPLHNKN